VCLSLLLPRSLFWRGCAHVAGDSHRRLRCLDVRQAVGEVAAPRRQASPPLCPRPRCHRALPTDADKGCRQQPGPAAFVPSTLSSRRARAAFAWTAAPEHSPVLTEPGPIAEEITCPDNYAVSGLRPPAHPATADNPPFRVRQPVAPYWYGTSRLPLLAARLHR
jgi:hypothetical protein